MTQSTTDNNSQSASKKLSGAFDLSRDHWGKLLLVDADGQQYRNVNITPLFPISEPTKWISILSSEGHELGCVEDPSQQSAEVRQLLADELAFRDFVPRISRVISVSGNSEPCEWHVQTNHGQTRFVLKSEEDIRRLSPHEVMIIDANGGRYRVDDTRLLDRKSRRYIEWYV